MRGEGCAELEYSFFPLMLWCTSLSFDIFFIFFKYSIFEQSKFYGEIMAQ